MIRELAGQDEQAQEMISDALEPPNRVDPMTGAPAWWVSDEDAWSQFQRQV
jgi:hypothetical protein